MIDESKNYIQCLHKFYEQKYLKNESRMASVEKKDVMWNEH